MSFELDKRDVEGAVMVVVNFVEEYDVDYLGCEACEYVENHYHLKDLRGSTAFIVQERFVKDLSVVNQNGDVVGVYDKSDRVDEVNLD